MINLNDLKEFIVNSVPKQFLTFAILKVLVGMRHFNIRILVLVKFILIFTESHQLFQIFLHFMLFPSNFQ